MKEKTSVEYVSNELPDGPNGTFTKGSRKGQRFLSEREMMQLALDPEYTEALQNIQAASDRALWVTRGIAKQCVKDAVMDLHAAHDKMLIDLAVKKREGKLFA